ncbi:MAG: YfhO family protein [Chloroflexi bacterium]|nr:YfhO family protein [Chloroflexota bacterium]
MSRARRLAPLLLLPLVALFFHRLALQGYLLARGDVYLYFYPYWEAAAGALREGRLPLWNPYLFMGAPLLANSQAGFFYPPNWPFWLLLPVHYAATASILLHLWLAAGGAYLLARRALRLSPAAAAFSALLFALGGYLTAQVEHLNQLQGLAWLPWALLVAGRPAEWRGRGPFLRRLALLALILALQLTAGHTQTLFITGVALGLWQLGGLAAQRGAWRLSLPALAGLLLAAGLAGALAAVQLLPTLELAGLSSRQGGLPLNEILSFSLHPLHLSRALLPGYGEALFTEYVAFLPLTALLLALLGAWRWRREPALRSPLLLLAAGLFLALGRFSLAYIGLALLPGFNLFRAPARWLALYALGAALLAGAGWERWRGREKTSIQPLRWGTVALALLFLWSLAAPWLARIIPTGAEAPAAAPSSLTLAGWLVELALALLLSRLTRRDGRLRAAGSFLLIAGVLYLSSRALPYHHLATAPQAADSLRPPVARLLALNDCPEETACATPPGRLLSLSNIFFDLGDMAELQTAYGDALSEAAFAQLLVAHKQKEVLDPNLPLRYGIPSVDGYDGGILPLRAYTALTSLVLPPGEVTADGRLREFLPAVPDARWLDLFQAQYLITDKTADEWHEEVFFDRQHPVALEPGELEMVGYLPPYEATAIWLLADGPGRVEATAVGERWLLETEPLADGLWEATLPQPALLDALELQAGDAAWTVEGLALVDSRDGSFQPLVPGAYRLIHSGDVKIYENLDVLPRAFVVTRWQWQPDVETSVQAMARPDFDPRQEAVLLGTGEPATGNSARHSVTFTRYEPEAVSLQVETDAPGLLLLTDAAYPGWRATLDGEPVTIYQADGLFRGVLLPAGSHEVTFTYEPASLRYGAALSLAALLVWLLLLTAGRARREQPADIPR